MKNRQETMKLERFSVMQYLTFQSDSNRPTDVSKEKQIAKRTDGGEFMLV